jgi:hypothetical protein
VGRDKRGKCLKKKVGRDKRGKCRRKRKTKETKRENLK